MRSTNTANIKTKMAKIDQKTTKQDQASKPPQNVQNNVVFSLCNTFYVFEAMYLSFQSKIDSVGCCDLMMSIAQRPKTIAEQY